MSNAQEGKGGDNGAAEKTNDDSNQVCAAIIFLNMRYQIIIWTDDTYQKVISYVLSLYNRCTPLLPILTCVIHLSLKQTK